MGCDIHATLEIKHEGNWVCLNDDIDLSRNYDAFGILFGVRMNFEIEPIAAMRGIPEDITVETKAAYDVWEGDAHSASYLTHRDISRIKALGAMRDPRIHIYKRWDDGEWMLIGKAEYVADIPEEFYSAEVGTILDARADVQYRIENVDIEHIFEYNWKGILREITKLGDILGENNVRLIVWFDN